MKRTCLPQPYPSSCGEQSRGDESSGGDFDVAPKEPLLLTPWRTVGPEDLVPIELPVVPPPRYTVSTETFVWMMGGREMYRWTDCEVRRYRNGGYMVVCNRKTMLAAGDFS